MLKPLDFIYLLDYCDEVDKYCYSEKPFVITHLEGNCLTAIELGEFGLDDYEEELTLKDENKKFYHSLEELRKANPQAITWEECNEL